MGQQPLFWSKQSPPGKRCKMQVAMISTTQGWRQGKLRRSTEGTFSLTLPCTWPWHHALTPPPQSTSHLQSEDTYAHLSPLSPESSPDRTPLQAAAEVPPQDL